MKKVLCAAILGLLFVGCAGVVSQKTADLNVSDLSNSSWTLVEISGKKPDIKKIPEIRFLEDRAAGFNGVNNFGANYKLSNGKLIFSQMVATQMAALSPELSKLEKEFTNVLLNAVSFEVDEDFLTIRSTNDTLFFKKIR
ncbi:MAG: META domain-containing protein [Campylobacteraceae bacterium]|jgi:heat shock protein HslJ|nr:META domain-containing protein [Campylobacteraceae bacterium]